MGDDFKKMRKKFLVLMMGLVLAIFLANNNIMAKTSMAQRNAKDVLKLPVVYKSYNSNQGTHPSVVSFEKKWNGYKYWMAFTPYKQGNSYYENPHIVASNNMINWIKPKGLKNPLDAIYDKSGKNYNSDTHLVYNQKTKKMEIIWRSVFDKKVVFYYKNSSDGVKWSKKKQIMSFTRSKTDLYSPALIFEDGKYRLWSISTKYKVEYRESTNLTNWSSPRILNINFPKNIKPWHIDAQKIDGKYHLLINAFPSKGAVKSIHRYTNSALYIMTSKNNINYTKPKKIMGPSKKFKYDNRGLYRSSIQKINGVYAIIYSSVGKNKSWNISLSIGEDLNNLYGYKQKGFNSVYKKMTQTKSVNAKKKQETYKNYMIVKNKVKLARTRTYSIINNKKVLTYDKKVSYHSNYKIKKTITMTRNKNKTKTVTKTYNSKGKLTKTKTTMKTA